MAISFEQLSSQKRQFLESIGVTEHNIPDSFFDVIEPYKEALTIAERFILNGDDSISKLKPFSIKDVVGTDHDRYAGQSWFEAFIDSARGDKLIEMYFRNPQYYDGLRQTDQSNLPHDTSIGLTEKEGKYYITLSQGGNNRMILMKIKYLALIAQAGDDQNRIDAINEQFTFVGKVKSLPKEKTTAPIYYALSSLLGLYSYKVRNTSTDPDDLSFRIMTDQKTFEGVGEKQLPGVFDSITSTYNPIELQDFYNRYHIDLGPKETNIKK